MMGTNIDDLKELKIKGHSKLNSEIEACKVIPEQQRRFMINHVINDDGEGEPS
jgi:hypothetical protein